MFLLSIPDVCSVHCPLPMRGGEMIVVGVEIKESSHQESHQEGRRLVRRRGC